MTLPDPLWTQLEYVQERAEAYARQREIRRQLRRHERQSAAAVWLGAGFIYFGDRMQALGGRLCPSCPDAHDAIESSVAAR